MFFIAVDALKLRHWEVLPLELESTWIHSKGHLKEAVIFTLEDEAFIFSGHELTFDFQVVLEGEDICDWDFFSGISLSVPGSHYEFHLALVLTTLLSPLTWLYGNLLVEDLIL